MTNHKADRDQIVAYLRHELFGPWEPWHSEGFSVISQGSDLNVAGEVHFAERKESYGPFVQTGSSDEILQRDRPCKRYGVGVLYPRGVVLEDDAATERPGEVATQPEVEESEDSFNVLTSDGQDSIRKIVERKGRDEPESDDFDLTGANE